ncbi:helix-turn-helix domain-containing protein [Microbacterium sp.]|uniref:helix-turn-helix domain-containing protein n=1 Tax=Microbacterium sp. TaxID=51671 RepID=UPI002735BF20|nr:helix-turn-helix transcriptional regulator [Microbacterium sp.]MDP3949517.1 helix-turn-helix transcriptional regulator [Microbacterium sp.]
MPRTPSAAAAHIGERITTSRKARSMSVDELAVASRIDSSNIRSYENGRALMNVQSLVRIAEALQVDAGELLDGVTSDMFGREQGR